MEEAKHKRARRTRETILDAFNALFLGRRQRRIRVGDVVAEAGLGRSTFYEHFSGAEQLHMAALSRPFAILADAAVGQGDAEATGRLLAHFWENRQRARDSLTGRTGDHALRLLASLVEERLPEPLAMAPRLASQQLAAATLAPLRLWLLGEGSSTPDKLAEILCCSGAALVNALRAPP
jgi:AcrR family transcriptional regulator